MDNNFYENERALESGQSMDTMGRHTAKTFGLMALGLLVTFAVAFFFSGTYTGAYLLYSAATTIPALHLVLLVAQLVVVIAMTAGLEKMSPTTATVCFFVYSALTGLTFTVYFIIFELTSLILVFAATALARSLPNLNSITRVAASVRDVSPLEPGASVIYSLYAKGILTGVDGRLPFNPDAAVTRAEAAALCARLARPEQRVELFK